MSMYLDQPDDEIYWRHVYQLGVTPDKWIASAKDLLDAMAVMRPAVIEFWRDAASAHAGEAREQRSAARIHGVYLLLGAYALENLLKALFLKRQVQSGDQVGDSLPKQLRSHSLVELSGMVGVALTDEGKHLLQRMSEYSVWAGRYPIPLNHKNLHLKELPGGRRGTLLMWRGADVRAIGDLSRHLLTALEGGEGSNHEHAEAVQLEPWEQMCAYTSVVPWGDGTISGKFE